MTNILKFDASAFDSLLDVAETPQGGKAKRARQTFLKHPGIRFSVASGPAGGLAYKKANKKNVLVDKIAKGVRGVVLNSEFAFSQWGKDNGAAKIMCSSVSHTTSDGSSGKGTWQVPLASHKLVDTLNPQGFKGKSCGDCIASQENLGCKQGGGIHILVTGLDHGETDEEDNFLGIQDVEPFIGHISASGMSAFQYTNFLLDLRKLPNKPAPDAINALFSTQDNPRAPVKMLKIDISSPFNNQALAKKLLTDELVRLAEEEAKRLEDWKAKNGNQSGNYGAKKKSTVDPEDDLPF